MAAGKSKRGSARARGLRTLQHQTLSSRTRYGIETEVWFRSLLLECRRVPEQDQRWSTKDSVHDEALGWFLQRHAQHACPIYPARRTSDEDLTFWVDSKLMERARRMAQRDGVKVARLIDAALGAYVEECVAPQLIQFRQRVQEQACKLYLVGAARRSRGKAASARSTAAE